MSSEIENFKRDWNFKQDWIFSISCIAATAMCSREGPRTEKCNLERQYRKSSFQYGMKFSIENSFFIPSPSLAAEKLSKAWDWNFQAGMKSSNRDSNFKREGFFKGPSPVLKMIRTVNSVRGAKFCTEIRERYRDNSEMLVFPRKRNRKTVRIIKNYSHRKTPTDSSPVVFLKIEKKSISLEMFNPGPSEFPTKIGVCLAARLKISIPIENFNPEGDLEFFQSLGP